LAHFFINQCFHASNLLRQLWNVVHRRSRIRKQWTDDIRKVQVIIEILQSRVQLDQFVLKIVPLIF